jgi:hypothetical protein
VQDTSHHLPDDTRLRRAFLTPLLLEDLNRITAGESNLDPDDWAAHTDVAGFDGSEVGKTRMGGRRAALHVRQLPPPLGSTNFAALRLCWQRLAVLDRVRRIGWSHTVFVSPSVLSRSLSLSLSFSRALSGTRES